MAPAMRVWGIDRAQRVFQLVGMDGTGAGGLGKRMARSDVWRCHGHVAHASHGDGRVGACPLLGPMGPRACARWRHGWDWSHGSTRRQASCGSSG
jgi:hypothetical protein